MHEAETWHEIKNTPFLRVIDSNKYNNGNNKQQNDKRISNHHNLVECNLMFRIVDLNLRQKINTATTTHFGILSPAIRRWPKHPTNGFSVFLKRQVLVFRNVEEINLKILSHFTSPLFIWMASKLDEIKISIEIYLSRFSLFLFPCSLCAMPLIYSFLACRQFKTIEMVFMFSRNCWIFRKYLKS